MRLFQNSGVAGYGAWFDRRFGPHDGFRTRRDDYLADRYGAPHLLRPVLDGAPDAFFTNGDDMVLQQAWAREKGSAETDAAAILLAQIEDHRTEIFYNLDPLRFGSDFVRRLPGCVRKAVCWRAAPSPGADFGAYDAVVCNFPSILASWRERGWHAAYFFPAHDPAMDGHCREDRPIDVCFVGNYSRHHRERVGVLDAVAALAGTHDVRFHLQQSRLTRLAEHPLLRLLPWGALRRPGPIRRASRDPVYGRALYDVLGQSKIVLNGAVDMAGADRGNMRCFEAMGCGALLVSDEGHYPEGMVDGETMLTYRSPQDAAAIVEAILRAWPTRAGIARNGHEMVGRLYSKQRQWDAFVALVASL